MTVVGIDACRKGWVVVSLSDGGPYAYFIPTIDRITEVEPDVTTIAIDIPIGLPEEGRRAADRIAFDYLGPRRHAVFTVPVRETLMTDDFAEANRISLERSGAGISRQSHALRTKIFEVDSWLTLAPCRVWEVHPEVSFCAMNGSPLEYSKKSWAGMNERRIALRRAGIDLDVLIDRAGEFAGTDDLLDAAAAAWSARRIEQGIQRSLPQPPEMVSDGQVLAIWY